MCESEKKADFLLFLGFVLMFIGIINTLSAKRYTEYIQNMIDDSSYRYASIVPIGNAPNHSDSIFRLIDKIYDGKSVVGLHMNCYIGKSLDKSSRYANLVLIEKYPDNYIIKMSNGSIMNLKKDINDAPPAVIGKVYSESCYEKNNRKYIMVCGIEFEVVGNCGCFNRDDRNTQIIIFGHSLTQDMREKLVDECGISIGKMLLSLYEQRNDENSCFDSIDLSQFVYPNDDIMFAKDENGRISKLTIDYYETTEEKSDQLAEQWFKVLSVLSAVAVLAFSKMWFELSRREIAIRKIFGFDDSLLGKYIGKRLMICLCSSVVSAYFCQQIINKLLGRELRMDLYLRISDVFLIMLFIFLTFFIVYVIEKRKMKRLLPAEIIRKIT